MGISARFTGIYDHYILFTWWRLAIKKVEYMGFFRYSGSSVKSGYLDARRSAEALLGLDDAIRFFVGKQSAELGRFEYEIPVRIQKGSWQALIPNDISTWVRTTLALGATTYLLAGAKKMADNDFKDIGLKQIFSKAIESIVWSIRIGKHLGSLAVRSFKTVKWRSDNREVGISNDSGELLYVPAEYLDIYHSMPSNLLTRIASVIGDNRVLEVAIRRGRSDDIVKVDSHYKAIFCPVDDGVLFPELTHGMDVVLEGLVTRGNENSNTIGFQYNDHILTCFPQHGSVVRFKPALFLRCRLQGTITRADKFGHPTELRPKIVFRKITPIKGASKDINAQPHLFDDDI